MTDYIQVATSVAQKEDAERIARRLVEMRLAACVQVLGPIASTYWWQGTIETAQEWLCVAKSRRERYPELEAAIKESHPYELPEILAIDVAAGSPAYLEWLSGELTRRDAP